MPASRIRWMFSEALNHRSVAQTCTPNSRRRKMDDAARPQPRSSTPIPGRRSSVEVSHSVSQSEFAPPLTLARTHSGWYREDRGKFVEMNRWSGGTVPRFSHDAPPRLLGGAVQPASPQQQHKGNPIPARFSQCGSQRVGRSYGPHVLVRQQAKAARDIALSRSGPLPRSYETLASRTPLRVPFNHDRTLLQYGIRPFIPI